MAFTIATWNINSVRLRESIVSRLMSEEMPDILCLQECKWLAEQIPDRGFEFVGQFFAALRQKTGQILALEVLPEPVDGIEVRTVGGQV